MIASLLAHLRPDATNLARERLRRVVLTGVASLFSRLGTAATLILTVPLALQHLGPERFGVWMVISSLAALLAFADFGIGNGVLNRVAAASAREDGDAEIVRSVSGGLVMLSALGGAVAVATIVAFPLADWRRLFQVSSPLAVAEIGPSMLVFLLCLALNLPSNLAAKAQTGLQEGYAVQAWTALGGLLSLATVTMTLILGGGVPALVLALFGSQTAASVGNYFWFFHVRRPELKPRLSRAERDVVTSLLRLGLGFFILQFVQAVTFRVDAFIVAQYFGPEQAGQFAVVDRLFSLASMVVLMALMPLWPAYGEAASRGDHRWLRLALSRSVLIAGGMTALSGLIIILFHGSLFRLWLGQDVAYPLLLLAGFAVWRTLEAMGTAIAMLMNGIGAVRAQSVMAVTMGVLATTLKLSVAVKLGISWVVWMTCIAYAICFLLPCVFVIPRLLDRLARPISPDAPIIAA